MLLRLFWYLSRINRRCESQMISMEEDTVYKWIENFDDFNYDFRRFCNITFQAFDLDVEFIPGALKEIHDEWAEEIESWLEDSCHPDTRELSPVKILAILLEKLASKSFLGNFFNHKYKDDPGYQFNGTAPQKKKAREDLIDNREFQLSFDFVIAVLAYYAENRVENVSSQTIRIGHDFRHDFLVYLHSGKSDAMAIYLIFSGLASRCIDAP